MECGGPINTYIHPTLADGLAVPMVGYNAYASAAPLIDKMVVVKEEWIALAILKLVEQEKSKSFILAISSSSLSFQFQFRIFKYTSRGGRSWCRWARCDPRRPFEGIRQQTCGTSAMRRQY